MKFLPVLRPVLLAASLLTLNACETPANRRELYNTSEPNGPWHDYARQREAEAEVGLPPGSTTKAPATTTTTTTAPNTRNNRPTPQPRSGPIQSDPTALPSTNTPAPSNSTTTTVSPAAAPVPTTPGETVTAPAATEQTPPAAPPQ